ncbi:hypothetical protein M0R45_009662 [Rubus argutus]|uniref:Uncharacterized protein n=1 Tax=Rubus argutus TaxID=59490 RepID=A0AAW1Y4P7_RUBAR
MCTIELVLSSAAILCPSSFQIQTPASFLPSQKTLSRLMGESEWVWIGRTATGAEASLNRKRREREIVLLQRTEDRARWIDCSESQIEVRDENGDWQDKERN